MTGRAYPARFLDGVQPHHRMGEVRLEQHSIRFVSQQGEEWVWPLESIRRTDTIAGERVVELQPVEGSLTPAQLTLADPEFDRELERLLDQHLVPGTSMMGRSLKRIPGWVWLLLAMVLLPTGYLLATRGAAAGHVLVSVEAEAKLGELIYQQVVDDWVVCDDQELQGQLQELVNGLADPDTEYDYRVTVFESDEPNAMAVPGGRILVLSGMFELCDDPKAMAGVLAHEIEHIEQRHTLKQILRALGVVSFMSLAIGGGVEQLEALETMAEFSSLLLVAKYSRAAEAEADALAVERLHRRGVSVGGLLHFFEEIQEEMGVEKLEKALFWASTHPVTESRITKLEAIQEKEVGLNPSALMADLPPAFHAQCTPGERAEDPLPGDD